MPSSMCCPICREWTCFECDKYNTQRDARFQPRRTYPIAPANQMQQTTKLAVFGFLCFALGVAIDALFMYFVSGIF